MLALKAQGLPLAYLGNQAPKSGVVSSGYRGKRGGGQMIQTTEGYRGQAYVTLWQEYALEPGPGMKQETFAALRRGIEAGLVASVPQVLGTHFEEKLLDLPQGSANIGPRFIQRLGKLTRQRLSEEIRWLGAASFHFGYAATWGALYALAYQRRPLHPAIGGLILSGAIYAVTFPNWGVATKTRTEKPPRRRGWRRELLLLSPPLIFGMGAALLYGRGPRPGEVELADEILRDPLRRREGEGRPAPRRLGGAGAGERSAEQLHPGTLPYQREAGGPLQHGDQPTPRRRSTGQHRAG